ncbi:MAG TPA: IPT/TIG domain-containing protein [Flavisolibacter sp.]|jgi:hypothetical protein|nr:IPT/TIG domain-containing protein [Flavisolibacter sp.]
MIQLSYQRLLALLCFVLFVGVLASCKKDSDDNNNDGTVQLLSFGPTGAKHGDTLRFIGRNLNKVTEVVFTGNNASVKQNEFKQQTPELILLVVPETAERGQVTLKTPNGDLTSKTIFNLNVSSSVTVASFTEQARPGANITISGSYLNWVKSITFNRDKVVSEFVNQSFNQLVVTIPEDAQTGPLVIEYAGTDSSSFETADTLKVTLPMTTAMTPNPVKPGTNLTITGTDLDLAKEVIFTGVATPVTTFVSQSATQLVVAVPITAKKGKLTLEAASGVQTTSAADLDIVLPMATAIAPASINLGTDLTITGTNLDLVRKVIFAGVAPAVTTFVSQSATQLVVRVPAGARTGKVTLEAASGVQTQTGNDLTVILPSITSFSPNPVDPGTNLTINGTRLDMVNSVTFQNAPAVTTFISKSASQIVVRVPNGALRGRLTLGITNPADTIQSAGTLELTGATPPPTIALPFYLDEISNWNGWTGNGWGGTKDINNTAPVREGSKSMRIDYRAGADYGSPFQLGGGNISLTNYTTFKISVYGAPGSGGKNIQVKLNGQNGPGRTITVEEGKWTDYSFPLSSFTGLSTITEIWVQDITGTGGFTVYLDAIGLN